MTKLGSVLRTRKQFIFHYGIYVGDNNVIDNSPHHGGVAFRTIDDFSGNVGFTITNEPSSLRDGMMRVKRAKDLLGRQYRLLSYNCEHFTNLIVFGHPSSKQVSHAITCATLGATVSKRPLFGFCAGAVLGLIAAQT